MKGLLITLLSASVYFLFNLAVGTTPDATSPSPPQAAGEAPANAPVVSNSENVTTSVVFCLGDSSTNGYPYAGTEYTYPARLQAMLDGTYGPGGYEVINHGVDGYRADQVLAGLQNLGWMAEDPDFVLLMIGGNDLTQETGGDPSRLPEVISQTVAEVQDIVNVVTTHTNADGTHPQIIVSAIAPTQDPLESLAVWSYNSSLENNLTRVDLWLTDNWDDFYNPATGQARASLMSDNEHPNEAGYLLMTENWFEATNSLVQKHKAYLPLVLRGH